ncbi:MAG: ABC transporter ATP-binding protein, partial [Deltaproteobacteria bacterium]|nr:ABC transporter ATP-binding protein [Deltaproteobacteria bacterium]
GTLLFVSHNQSFVNRLATKIWDIRGQGIVEYQGKLDEYYEHLLKTDSTSGQKERDVSNNREPGSLDVKEEHRNHSNKKKEDRKREKRERAEKRQLIYDTLKPIQDRLEDLEEKISAIEERQVEVEKILADPDIFGDKERSVPLLTEYKDIREKLDKLLFKWEKDQDRLESAKMKLEG